MLGIVAYCFGVMYTPGPVNILSLHAGTQRPARAHAAFCLGVACALYFWFLVSGYAGGALVNEHTMPLVAAPGSCFIAWLAVKIIRAPVALDPGAASAPVLTFKDGLLMQLLNPKSFMAVLPVTTIQFPASGIQGPAIAAASALLCAMAFGAPMAYTLLGAALARRTGNTTPLRHLNTAMGLLLLAVAADVAYRHVYLPLR